jgi:hypothetical protein
MYASRPVTAALATLAVSATLSLAFGIGSGTAASALPDTMTNNTGYVHYGGTSGSPSESEKESKSASPSESPTKSKSASPSPSESASESASPSASASPSLSPTATRPASPSVSPSPGLPVTGPAVGGFLVYGLISLLFGGGLLIVARRMRRSRA